MKNKINKSIELIKKVFSNFPITNISIMITSMVFIIFIDNDETKVLETILWFLTTFSVLSYYFESKYSYKLKLYQYLILTLIPLLITVLTNYETFYESDIFIRFIIWYFIVFGILSIYYNYKKSKSRFSEYLVSVFSNLLETFITNTLLMTGLILVVLTFDILILGNTGLDYLWKIMILESGFYFAPSVIFSFSNVVDANKFVKTLITRLLYILVLIAYVIIYLYIFKIVITFNMPSNQIFRITAILFMISTPIYLMENLLETNDILMKINKIFIYLFIPFIILQIYSLGIRIYEYGFTIIRYLGVMLIIFEIIYTVISILKKPIENIVIIFLLETTIALIIPFINCYDFSIINQAGILSKYKTTDLVKARGAYYYLNNYDKGKDKINKLLTKKEIDEIINYYYKEDTKYIYSSKYYKYLDIEGYNKIEFLDNIYYDTKTSTFSLNNDVVNNELVKVLDKYISNADNIDEYFDAHNEIIINVNFKIVLTSISIDLTESTINYVNFNGYLLER